jgi:tetratricopeptide (TPR) repeat protein
MEIFTDDVRRAARLRLDDDHDSLYAQPVIRLALALVAAALTQQVPAAPAQSASPDETAIRAAVQEYFDAQAARDPDKAASFWSASANPRVTRDTFIALFGSPADERYTIDVRAVVVRGSEARVRVSWMRTRVETRGGQQFTARTSALNAETWRKEGDTWKLLRDAPFADELADEYLALPPGDRAGYVDRQTPPDRAMLRYAVSQRATMAITLGKDYPGGRTLFERALEISRATGDRVGEANSLHNIGQADYVLRDYPAATEAFSKELAVAREAADEAAAGGALYGLGMVAYASGEYSSALVSYRDALALYEKRDEGASANRALISIGNIQYLQADYDGATASYRRAETLGISGQDPQGASLARSGLARVLAAQGDLAAALDMYGRVLADARGAAAADPRLGNAVATTLESIGEVHFRLGNVEQARAAFEEAKRLVDRDPDFSARLYSSLGLTELVAGRYDSALADYTESRARFVKAKDAASAGRAWIGIGFAHAANEKWDESIAAYNSAIRELEGRDEDRARAWLGLSLAQSGAGDNTAALESARRVLGIADALKNLDLSWRANVRSGEALTKLAKLDEARASFEAAIAVIDGLAQEAPVNPDARGQLNDSASAWAGLAIARAKGGDARGALVAAEARRAHIRRMHLAAFQADITRGESDEERAAEQSLAREIVATRAQVKAESGGPHPDTARLERLTDKLTDLTARRAALQTQLYARIPGLAEWRGVAPPPDVDLDALAPNASTVAIEYVMTDDELLVLAVDRGDAGAQVTSATLPLKRHGLAEDVAAAMKPSVIQDRAQWRKAAEPLRRSLLASVGDKLRDRDTCVVVPDDVIWKVPIEALRLDSGQDAADGDGDLGARMHVTYATSFAALALERRLAASRVTPAIVDGPPVRAAFVVAPTIADAVRAQLAITQPGWKEADAVVALARVHADAAAYGDAAVVKSGADATKAAVRALFADADVVQLSAPLHVSGPTPLFSSVLLVGGESGSPDDSRWEAREWFAVEGRARVLVLDDASTLGGAGVAGAMDTLAWAAAAAGVSTIVVARWPADAYTPDALETAFHGELAKGAPAAAAWAAAVKTARKTSLAPASWAGFRFIGVQ